MSGKVLFIGDVHIRPENIIEVEEFKQFVVGLIIENNYEYIVMAGDILHTHEKLHTLALNCAIKCIETFAEYTKVICMVGNHDMINNQQFLTNNHWLTVFENKNTNIIVVERPKIFEIGKSHFMCVPYVFPGRFVEAMDTNKKNEWKTMDCIFAHQEFRGCRMGAIVSEIGDEWDLENPLVISGHIHDYQKPQTNIFYPGTPLQHSFGDTGANIIVEITFEEDNLNIEEIKTTANKKKTISCDVEKIKSFDITKIQEGDKNTRITIVGNNEELKSIKKTAKYKELLKKGVKVVLKTQREETVKIETEPNEKEKSFEDILVDILNESENIYVMTDYQTIFHGKEYLTFV